MKGTNETITDIIAEMRDWLGDANSYDLRSLADRLEAARKREKATAEKSSTVGDAAKLREALLRCDAIAQLPEVRNEQSIKDMRNIIRQAFSAPPRNCDVGTAEEQFERWYAFCDRYDKDCTGCPCKSPYTTAYCFAIWAQMPYEEGESK